ncbi:Glu-tRNA(Gln) amidotransferase subunit GatE, partial [bacterium]|nr:Glu-tRNA(Gln) amidotransferase subunit GatE [bacterium]
MAKYAVTNPVLTDPLPIYGSWTEEDYKNVGLISGLEVHQQLLSVRKLFCRCPAGIYSKIHDAEILRHMRPTLSEMGDYDGTALMEFKTRKEITYLLKNETVCTYEMDDAPPFEIDDLALDSSIYISMMMGLQVVDEIHIARKQYLDGSIPTGFQRTAIIGVTGSIPFNGKSIAIRQLSIEEDSCREVQDQGHDMVFRADRLGMPLIETVTDPDMKTPDEVAQVCEIIRQLNRATGLVRTGCGAGRQDVNVSITGGTRIEIKGVSSIKQIPVLVHNEALRQRALLAIRDELQERGITEESIVDNSVDVTELLSGTDYRFLSKALDKGNVVSAVPLTGFEGLLVVQTQPRTAFLKEFSDRVRVIACINRLPNLLSSTDGIETLSSSEWEKVEKATGVNHGTPVLIVWGDKRDVETATTEILIRAREATVGIPEETRQSLVDGTNGFERILPGASRMYPDTDLPPEVLTSERLDKIRGSLVLTPWERLELLKNDGVNDDLANRLSINQLFILYKELRDLPDGKNFNHNQLASLLLDRDCPRPKSMAALQWWRD